MINSEIRFVAERIICGNYLKKYPTSECNIKDDGKCVKFPTRIGKLYGPFPPTQPTGGSILLCGKRQSYFPFQCFVGPDWPMLIAVYFLIFSVNLIVLPIISYLGWPVVLIGSVGFFLLLYCYSAVACSNPGIVFDEYEEELVPFNTTTTTTNNNNNNNNNTIIDFNASSTTVSSPSSTTTAATVTAVSLELSASMNPLNYNVNNHNHNNHDSDLQTNSYSNNDIENQNNNNRINNNDSNNNNSNDYNCNHSDTDSSSNDSSTSLKRTDNDYDEEKKDEMTVTNNNISVISKNSGIIITSSSSSSSSPTIVVASSSSNSSSNNNNSHHHHHSRNKKDQDRPTIECGTCEIQRPYTARHCHHCGVCIEDLDHHCPWCSKCIGKKNMIFFKSFLAILCFQCYFLIGSLVYYFIAISKKAPLPIGPQFPNFS